MVNNKTPDIDDLLNSNNNSESSEPESRSHKDPTIKSKKIFKEKETNLKEKEDDQRSIFVKNLEYTASKDDIESHFKEFGDIKRITIIYDKVYKQPTGKCYIEFSDNKAKEKAIETKKLYKGRVLEVSQKRTNIPFLNKNKKKNSNFDNYLKPFKGKKFNNY